MDTGRALGGDDEGKNRRHINQLTRFTVNPVYQFWAQKRTQLTIWNPAQGSSRGTIGPRAKSYRLQMHPWGTLNICRDERFPLLCTCFQRLQRATLPRLHPLS